MSSVENNINITTLHKFDTTYPADSVEWCPNEGFRSYFTCGTYNLERDNVESSSQPCRRNGSLILLKFDVETKEFIEVYRRETAAILDMKWMPSPSSQSKAALAVPTLATANALGEIHIYTLDSNRLELRTSIELNTEHPNFLALALDWDWPIDGVTTISGPRRIIVSDSRGDISVLKYTSEDVAKHKLEKTKSWSAHNFEAWICSFDKWNHNLAYTGGDDLLLHAFDLRTFDRVLSNRSHNAGVTSMLSHPKREHILLTGSYDENMRIFDTRFMRNPLEEINLQGGIWRLKPDPFQGDFILAACMYKNFSIVRMPPQGSGEYCPTLGAVYEEHSSICYGAEWCLDVNADQIGKDLYMATCSFYDNKLCVSHVEIQE